MLICHIIHDYDDLGRYYLEELEVSKVPAHLQNYIDYEAYGRDVALEENGTFTDQGYVWDTEKPFMSIMTASVAVSPTSTG